MKYSRIPIMLAAASLAAPAMAFDRHDELELGEAQLYFELNDTDGDLGIHGKADGDAWRKIRIDGPEGRRERNILRIDTRSAMRRQGLTELFFESAEPTFDELDPEVFFARFPQGLYQWEGRTIDYEEIEGEVFLSHIIPAAPVVTGVGTGGETNPGFVYDDEEDEVAKECWAATPDGDGNVVITWDAVTMSHRDVWDVDVQPLLPGEDLRYGGEDQPERKFPLGASAIDAGVNVADLVMYYEFVAEVDETPFKVSTILPPQVHTWTVPAEFVELAPEGEIKIEIIVRVETGEALDEDGELVESRPGNQSAIEDCFAVEI